MLRNRSALTAVCTYCQIIKGVEKLACVLKIIMTSLKEKLKTGCCVKNSRVYKLYSVTICKRLVISPKICVVKDKEYVHREVDISHQQH
jgi:hypothetical protein